ncbi:MAG: hypothetical protein KDA20_02080 [Phycisphaerales bacterium]|nr:hypothetical protein [Phycisphaerales bacterium]
MGLCRLSSAATVPMTAPAGSLWAASTPESRRVRRMLLLFVAIGLMSATDLALTVIYMQGPGMLEVNPIARPFVEAGSASSLAMFKIFTVGVACISMFAVRRHRRAEVCAWACTAVLVGLTAHWVRYNSFFGAISSDLTAVTCQADPPTWLHVDN